MAFTERYVSSLASGGTGTIGDPWDFPTAVANYAAGDRVNVKADGTYSIGSTTLATSSTNAAPIWWRGYGTTIGDGVQPEIAHSATFNIEANAILFSDLYFVAGTGGYAINMASSGVGASFLNVKIVQPSTLGNGVAAQSNGISFYGCVIDVSASTSSSGRAISLYNGYVNNCRIITGVSTAIHCQVGNDVSITNNVIVSTATSIGIKMLANAGKAFIVSNTLYGHSDSIRIEGAPAAGTTDEVYIANNIIHTCTYGVLGIGGNYSLIRMNNNAIGNATTARYSGLGDAPIHNDIVLTADPFVDAAGGDFTLNSVAGGGALCRGAGLEAPSS